MKEPTRPTSSLEDGERTWPDEADFDRPATVRYVRYLLTKTRLTTAEKSRLAYNLAALLYISDSEHFVAGCGDVTTAVAELWKALGIKGKVEVEAGVARRLTDSEPVLHAWLLIDGRKTDPTWQILFGAPGSTYEKDPAGEAVLPFEDGIEHGFSTESILRDLREQPLSSVVVNERIATDLHPLAEAVGLITDASKLTDEDRLQILEEAVGNGLMFGSGFCGATAEAINVVLFDGLGTYVGACNRYLWEEEQRFVGHVGVKVGDKIWDAEGAHERDEYGEYPAFLAWGQLDLADIDDDVGNLTDDEAMDAMMIELTTEELRRTLPECPAAPEAEPLLEALRDWHASQKKRARRKR